jgi:hypothetical protein
VWSDAHTDTGIVFIFAYVVFLGVSYMTYCCEMIHTKYAMRERINSHLKQKAFKFAQLFEDRGFMDYSWLVYFQDFPKTF